MRTICPSASACLLVVFVASVSYAETRHDETGTGDNTDKAVQVEASEKSEQDAAENKVEKSTEKSTEKSSSSVDVKPDSIDQSPTLSVAPLDHEIFPKERPTWIREEPDFESDVHTWVVTTSGRDSIEECEAEIEVLKRATVALYIKKQTDWVCDEDTLDEEWIENELVTKTYVGTLQRGDQQLNEIAIELSFDQDARSRIEHQWKSFEVNDRLRASGGLFAMVLVGLCCSGGLLSVLSRRFG